MKNKMDIIDIWSSYSDYLRMFEPKNDNFTKNVIDSWISSKETNSKIEIINNYNSKDKND
jgi:hypothetical protein